MCELGELCAFDFLLLLRDSVIYDCSGTKEGREYLQKCFNFANTEPDRASLREAFGKK